VSLHRYNCFCRDSIHAVRRGERRQMRLCNMNFRIAFDMLSTFFQTILAFLGEACCHFAPPTSLFFVFFRFTPKPTASHTNRFQREFSSKVAIATQEFFLASSHPRQKTNLFKPRRAVTSRRRKRRAVTSRLRPESSAWQGLIFHFGMIRQVQVREF
jgi:hypothetical protein